MIGRLSRQTVRRSWPAYVGALVALSFGTLLLSLTVTLVGATAQATDRPGVTTAERMQLDDLSSLFGFMAGISLFMAMFVVASTFGFVVATRRRELGLLRLVGATPRQVRRLVLTESAVVAGTATVLGCALGTGLAPAALWLVRDRGVTDLALHAPAPWLAWSIAGPCAAGVALVACWRAARRASKVSPLAALREAAVERRRPGVVQWLVGLSCVGGVVAAQVLAARLDPIFALVTSILAPEVVVLGVMCFGDAIFPALAGVLARPFVGRDVTARLARDQVRASARTTASLAAPVVAISAIGGSLLVALSFTADWSSALDLEQLRAPLVVETGDPAAASTVLGRVVESGDVAVADVRRTTNLTLVQAGERDVEQVDVVERPSAVAARGLRAVRGDLDALHGRAIAVTESWLSDSGSELGGTLRAQVHGRTVPLRIVAVVRDGPDLYGELVVDRSLLGARAPATGTVFVVPRTTTSAAAASLRHDLRGTGASVLGASAWVDEVEQQTRASNTMVLWVMLGPAGAYAAIAVVNTVLIGVAQRRRQLRVVRLLGATGSQVRRTALWEAALAGCAGLAVGLAVVAWVGQLVGRAIVEDVPATSLTMPWTPLAAIAATCIGLVLVAAAIGARRTGRT